MHSFGQSFSWWNFKSGIELEDLLAGAAKIGYRGIDFLLEEYWPLAGKHGLTLAAMGGHNSVPEGLNRRENAPRIEGELRTNIAKAEKWKIPVVVCFSGNRDGQSDEMGLEICAETLGRVAPMAANAGVTLALEMLNSKVNHPDYQADHTSWGIELCRRLNSPAVKLVYDIYHMQIMEGDVIRTIQQHHALFAHYHTAGNPGRGPLDGKQELNYSAITAAIAATGFTGFVAHEFNPAGDPLEALATAYRLCQPAQAF